MKAQCPHCQKVFSAPYVYKGRQIKCPSCHKDLVAEPITKTANVQVSKQPAPPRSNRNLWILAIIIGASLALVIGFVFVARKRTQQKIQAIEKELPFREVMEATRKAESTQLLKIYEEEKREEEKREKLARTERREKEYREEQRASEDRQFALIMATIQAMQASQPKLPGRIPTIPELMAANQKSASSGQKKEREQARPAIKTNLQTQAVTGRWQVFETTTIDGWVKKVKRGTIFKTTSGNIYEVVNVVILLEMELRPEVTILTDGSFYKLLIKGVDEELLCKKLNPGNKGIVSGGCVIEARITNDFDGFEHGNIYKLDNDQVWEQTDFYIYIYIAVMPKVTIWQDGLVHKIKVAGIDKVVTVKQLR